MGLIPNKTALWKMERGIELDNKHITICSLTAPGALDNGAMACVACAFSAAPRTNHRYHLTVHGKTEHRRKLKHYNIPGHAHYLTFSYYRRFDFLSDPENCSMH
jgi:hypothetical protein